MTGVQMNTDIRSLLEFYRTERRIFGRCPHCGEAFRLSGAKLTYGKEPPRDILSQLKRERDRLTEKIEELEGTMVEERESHERELANLDSKWRMRTEIEVEKGVTRESKAIRRDAIERSRVTTLGKAVERVAPFLSGFGHHPGDVRALFEPIDFIVFEGLWSKEVTEIVFVEFKTGGAALSPVQRSVREVVDRKRVRFEELRVSKQALRRMLSGHAGKKPVVEGQG